MRGLAKAALLLAPALARASPLQSPAEDAIPSAYIRLSPFEEESDVRDLTFRLDINESNEACGFANVSINGATLSKDGRGSLALDQGTTIIANWNFTCVTWDEQPKEQLMSMNVDFVNGKAVNGLGFAIRFQQTAPVWISDIEGPATMTRVHKAKLDVPSDDRLVQEDFEGDLDRELAELEFLRYQMVELEQMVYMKERHLAEAFGWTHRKGGIRDCDNLKCVMQSIYRKVSDVAMAFYGDVAEYEEFFDGPPPHGGPHGGPHDRHGGPPGHPHGGPGEEWHFKHHKFGKFGKRPFPEGMMAHGPKNHTHGNHTFPPPPWRRPHHPPPFCHCPPPPGPPPPPPPPPPPGPHGEWPMPPEDEEPPRHKFPGEGHPGDHPEEHHGFHEGRPGFEHEHEREHEHGSHQGRPQDFGAFEDDGMPPPPPKDGPPDHEAPMPPWDGPDGPPPPPWDGPDGPPPPPPPPPGPPGGHHHHPGDHGVRPPPPPPPGHHHGPPRPHFASPFKIGVSAILLFIFVGVLHKRCCMSFRKSRAERKAARRAACRQRRAAARGKLQGFMNRLLFGQCRHDDCEEEEKAAMLGGNEEDDEETTMAEEIASFRTAAAMVSDIVAAEEGRIQNETAQRHQQQLQVEEVNQARLAAAQLPPLPSPNTAFAHYVPGGADDVLPAYEYVQGPGSDSSSMVADGFRYTPGSSDYTPSSNGSVSGGADDVLGDTKH